jgi:hypothetical protein
MFMNLNPDLDEKRKTTPASSFGLKLKGRRQFMTLIISRARDFNQVKMKRER